MLDPAACASACFVALLFPVRQRMILLRFALNVRAITQFLEEFQDILREISRIAPNVTARVLRQKLREHLTVMHVGGSYSPAADKLVLHIHCDVVLVAVKALFALLRPAGVHILLPTLCLAPVRGRVTCLDGLVFFFRPVR